MADTEDRRDQAGDVAAGRARAIIENSYDLLSELDADGITTWVSPNVREATGFAPEDLVGKPGVEFIHPEDVEVATEGIAETLATGRRRQHTYRLRRSDGGWIWFEASASTYIDDSGQMRILVVSRDVTERQQHLEEREGAIREKEEALAQVKMLSGLLPICTHCRKVRDDEGYWRNLETYVSDNSDCMFSHSLCEPCLKEHYGHIVGDEV